MNITTSPQLLLKFKTVKNYREIQRIYKGYLCSCAPMILQASGGGYRVWLSHGHQAIRLRKDEEFLTGCWTIAKRKGLGELELLKTYDESMEVRMRRRWDRKGNSVLCFPDTL